MKIGILQRVLAGYRVPFFDELAGRFDGGVTLFAGKARAEEMIDESRMPTRAVHFPAENVHLFSRILKGKLYLCIQRNVLDWLERENPDVLICEGNFRYLTTLAAISWMKRRGRPVIGWGLGAGGWDHPLKRAFLRSFNALITYSETGAGTYAAAGVAPERIFVAKNAVSPRPTRTETPERAETYGNDGPVLLSVGRLQARKRIDLLIESSAALEDEFHPVLRIVGDGPERAKLEAYARERYPRAVFTGALYGEALETEFANADLFVLPGTGGLALQQAMANGLPVIAAEADGTQADLIRADNGRMIPPGDGAALTASIAELLRDPTRLRAMGRRSFTIVRDEINLEAMTDRFVEAVRFVTEEEKPR